MTLLLIFLSAAVVLLTMLVLGLLRSHAAILRKLESLGLGDAPPITSEAQLPVVGPGVVTPTAASPGRPAADLAGTTPEGGSVGIAVTGVRHDTVVAFLSSSCSTCEAFWERFAGGVDLPPATRLVVVTRGADQESPAEVAGMAPADTTVLMSTEVWEDYQVPGSPYVVLVDGASGTVRGEGTGGSWQQVAKLLAQATGDVQFLEGISDRRPKVRSDAERERDTDRALLAAGIQPGDPSLYRRADETEVSR